MGHAISHKENPEIRDVFVFTSSYLLFASLEYGALIYRKYFAKKNKRLRNKKKKKSKFVFILIM